MLTSQTEIRWVGNLVSGWIGQDGFGMNTGLVVKAQNPVIGLLKGMFTGLPQLPNFQVSQLVQLVLGQDIITVSSDHSSH